MIALRTPLNLKNVTAYKSLSCLFVLACLSLPLAGQAKIYQTKDANGNVSFTDKATDGAKEVELPPDVVTTIPPMEADEEGTKINRDADDQDDADAGDYDSVEILSPFPNQNLHNIGTVLPVAISIQPPLDDKHGLAVFLDGHPVRVIKSTAQDVIKFSLPDVVRGTHELQVHVIDLAKPKELLVSSEAVAFTVHQNSRLNTFKPIGSPKKLLKPKKS